MKIEIEISDERISDQLCAAFEGGSNYWLRSTACEVNGDRPSRPDRTLIPLQPGGAVRCTLQDAHDKAGTTVYVLNRAAIERGIVCMRKIAPRHFADIINENDDATTGDVFLQCCLFGEVVYG